MCRYGQTIRWPGRVRVEVEHGVGQLAAAYDEARRRRRAAGSGRTGTPPTSRRRACSRPGCRPSGAASRAGRGSSGSPTPSWSPSRRHGAPSGLGSTPMTSDPASRHRRRHGRRRRHLAPRAGTTRHAGHVPDGLTAARTLEAFRERDAAAGRRHHRRRGRRRRWPASSWSTATRSSRSSSTGRSTAPASRRCCSTRPSGRSRRRGTTSAWLAVVVGNARARRFYEKRGWRDEGDLALRGRRRRRRRTSRRAAATSRRVR